MERLADQLKALSDPNRLRILEFLRTADPGCCSREDGVCACDLEAHLGLAQPTVSHHMKILTDAGFVQAERRGRWVYYGLAPDAFRELAAELLAFEQAARATERELA